MNTEIINIENMIYEIRGVQVMLDSDLAKLYQIDTKRINESVTRNKEKFPKRFSWILEKEDLNVLWSQNATANISKMTRVHPRVFREQRIIILSGLFKKDTTLKVNITKFDNKYLDKLISSKGVSNE